MMAKKTGKPNDDFPAIEKTRNIAAIKYERFVICLNKAAIIEKEEKKEAPQVETFVSPEPFRSTIQASNDSTKRSTANKRMDQYQQQSCC